MAQSAREVVRELVRVRLTKEIAMGDIGRVGVVRTSVHVINEDQCILTRVLVWKKSSMLAVAFVREPIQMSRVLWEQFELDVELRGNCHVLEGWKKRKKAKTRGKKE